ncbi:MAG: FtsX-like permease family protein [Clostridia bacterium]|nr:FtsX-like permease family protein [Clostridia bacterium]
MNIVLKWNFRTLFSDVPRLILTICSIAVTFTLLTSMGVTLGSFVLATDSPGNSLPGTLNAVVSPVILAAFAVTVYALFAVSLAERKNQYHIMSTAGCTTRQLLKGLMAEAFTLDLTGAALGVGLGYLLAALQLKTGGYSLIPSVIFQSNVLLLNLLPALLLPPCMMLLASLQLFLPQRDRRRKRPPRRKKAVFSRRLPRLFGAGGSLEYAMEHNERRHHTALVLSLAVNLTVIILATVCLFLMSNARPLSNEYDVWLWYNYSAGDDSALSDEINALIEEKKENGEITKYAERDNYFGSACLIMDNTQINDTVFSTRHGVTQAQIMDSKKNTIFPLDNKRQFIKISLAFMDEAQFGRFCEENGIDRTADGAVLFNYSWVCNRLVEPLDPKSLSSLNVRLFPRGTIDMTGLGSDDRLFDPSPLINTPAAEIECIEVPVIGYAPYNAQNVNYLSLSNGKSLFFVMPMQMRERFLPQLNESRISRYFLFMTPYPNALVAQIKQDLNGLSDYGIRDYFFSGSTNQIFPSSIDEQWIVINNVRLFENDYEIFISRLSIFYRVILLLVFFCIGLNIVNTVHMNRLSRRREYAILSSIGMDHRKRQGMLLFESIRFFIRGIVVSVLLMLIVMIPLSNALSPSLSQEALIIEKTIETDMNADDMFVYSIQVVWNYIVNIAYMLVEYRWVVLGVVCFLFFGFLLAEHLVMNRMDKDDLVITLKDDMHE